ncbi:MAG: putative rRNA maturation factor [Candidatus Moranbacteria bacterium GW2011_GWE1_36_7]|nr:MAG: putative rRNA maturation factor [Candidatus Moranbacteria bacterium GW2011_GWD2_36_12]KKQ04838.1 MAG: putative rRNA maturation factor [Candidatus Moranbacteria bacterium GW2011_GWE2_36_40]KKQ12262.1 MAG: putative rRNA maturation factor [Candidatus Moranbacteria bacterium GW2011_GWE1_36_7]
MKLILEINNRTTQKFSRKNILGIFEHTLKLAKLECLKDKELELSVAILSEAEIQKLNSDYRKKIKPTDVLSFCEHENSEKLCAEKRTHVFLGELILCSDVISKNAKKDDETFQYAFTYVVSHGILHLLGFDHGKKMFSLQKQVADELVSP